MSNIKLAIGTSMGSISSTKLPTGSVKLGTRTVPVPFGAKIISPSATVPLIVCKFAPVISKLPNISGNVAVVR